MKKEYDLKKLRKRPDKIKTSVDASRIHISIRLDGNDLADIRTEANRLGIPYQSYISSILHRYVSGELIDLKSVNIDRLLKIAP